MFNWLKKRVVEASNDSMKNDIVRFISGLKGAGSEEVSTMIVVANVLRLNLIEMGKIPPAALDFSILRDRDLDFKCDMCPMTLTSAIKKFQSMNQPTDAFGVMIWLHSVWALNVPELRIYGREMWQELSRGFPLADEALEQVRALTNNALPTNIANELRFVPRGLEPFP